MADKFDDLVRAVPEDQVHWLDTDMRGEFLLQIERIAVGVEIQLSERFFHGGDGNGRGPEWILVRSHFDDALDGETEFARDVFDGAAGLIGRDVL